MAEISSGSFAPPQSAIAPPANSAKPPGLNDNDEDERAVRKSGESESGGGESQTDVRRRESAEADKAENAAEKSTDVRANNSGSQVDINV